MTHSTVQYCTGTQRIKDSNKTKLSKSGYFYWNTALKSLDIQMNRKDFSSLPTHTQLKLTFQVHFKYLFQYQDEVITLTCEYLPKTIQSASDLFSGFLYSPNILACLPSTGWEIKQLKLFGSHQGETVITSSWLKETKVDWQHRKQDTNCTLYWASSHRRFCALSHLYNSWEQISGQPGISRKNGFHAGLYCSPGLVTNHWDKSQFMD